MLRMFKLLFLGTTVSNVIGVSTLLEGERLSYGYGGDEISLLENKDYRLTYQSDHNLVLREGIGSCAWLWQSATSHSNGGKGYAEMRNDGVLELNSDHGPMNIFGQAPPPIGS